jgi:hypothetical protein
MLRISPQQQIINALNNNNIQLSHNYFLGYYTSRYPQSAVFAYIYWQTYQTFANQHDIIEEAMRRWALDYREENTIGPRFSEFIWELFGINYPGTSVSLDIEWMMESVIRDLVVLKLIEGNSQ